MVGRRRVRARGRALNAVEHRRERGWHRQAVAAVMTLLLSVDLLADELAPEQVIANTSTAIANAIAKRHREFEKDTQKLYALIDELVRPTFDFEGACRLILRDHWTQAAPAQRQRFVASFYHFLLASYGTALLEFRYDTITVLPADEPPDDSTARVRTVMRLSDGSTYHVDYYMRHSPAGWRILDVIAEGVSYVRTYRTDVGAEVRANGLDAVIQRFESAKARKSASPK
jgi:phospholipid transport system substrate-binding protein